MGIGAPHSGSPVAHGPRFTILPATALGWWAVGLSAGFWALIAVATAVPRGAGLGFLLGLAGFAAAVIAIIRDGERAALVLVTFVPAVIAVAFLVAELVGG